jgi:hypothetical protein
MATCQLFFSVQGSGGSSAGPDQENRVGDQDIGIPGRNPAVFQNSVLRHREGRVKDLSAPHRTTSKTWTDVYCNVCCKKTDFKQWQWNEIYNMCSHLVVTQRGTKMMPIWCHAFIYGLFSDITTNCNSRMYSTELWDGRWIRNWKRCRWGWSWPNFRQNSPISLEELRNLSIYPYIHFLFLIVPISLCKVIICTFNYRQDTTILRE